MIDNRLDQLEKSATLAINEKVAELKSKGQHIYSFGLGQSPFPVPECIVDELRKYAGEKDYLNVQGLPALRDAVAQFHHDEDHLDIDPDNVLIGPGSKELLFILQLVYNAEILIPTPCWVSYYPQAKIAGRKVSYLHTSYDNDWKLTPELLSAHCEENTDQSRLLILNYPSNPTGVTYNASELEKLADVARRHNIIIVSDEIYGRVHHQGQHHSMAKFYPEGTIVSSGLSKWCGAGGWRLGTFTFPENLKWLMNAMTVVASETFTSVSAPIQYAAVLAFKGNTEIDQYLINSRTVLSALGEWIVRSLQDAGVKVIKPEGGFYVMPDFSNFSEKLKRKGIESSTDFSNRLLEEAGVATLPGSCFGLEEGGLLIRMSYVDFDGAKAIEAANSNRIDDSFLEAYCQNALKGIRKLIEWLE